MQEYFSKIYPKDTVYLLPYALYMDKNDLNRAGASATPVNIVSLAQPRPTVFTVAGTNRFAEIPSPDFTKLNVGQGSSKWPLLRHYLTQATLHLALSQLKDLGRR